jgi:hypothetical protein
MKPASYYEKLYLIHRRPFADVVELIREEVELDLSCDCTALEFGDDDEDSEV